jgi:hypothetical protein
MATDNVQWREPIEIASGDTLKFKRYLPDFSAADGWSLDYELRGQGQAISFQSVTDTDGKTHSVTVSTSDTSSWLPGEYALYGYAVNTTSNERNQIYYGTLTVYPDAQTLPAEAVVKTFAQKMVDQIELVMLAKAGDDLAASQIGETRFQYLTPAELRTEHGYWKSVRRNEIALEKARNGKPTGNKIRPRFGVMSSGPGVGMFTRGSGYYGW